MNEQLLTFNEVRRFVRSIPSEKWDYAMSKKSNSEYLISYINDNHAIYLFGNNQGNRTGNGLIELESASVQLTNINGRTLQPMLGKKMSEIYFVKREKGHLTLANCIMNMRQEKCAYLV